MVEESKYFKVYNFFKIFQLYHLHRDRTTFLSFSKLVFIAGSSFTQSVFPHKSVSVTDPTLLELQRTVQVCRACVCMNYQAD